MKRIFPAIPIFLILSLLLPVPVLSASKSHKKPAKHRTHQARAKSVRKSARAPKAPAAQAAVSGPTLEQVLTAYKYAYALYADQRFEKAKPILKKLAILPSRYDINADSLYLYSQCAFRTEAYLDCVKALTVLAKRYPDSPPVTKGYVSRFCVPLIDDIANVQTHWDYFRFEERVDAKGDPIWKESVPLGFKIKRINFKLGFGLYRVLDILHPHSAETADAKQRLDRMLNAPITMLWVDEKAPPNRWGHPEDFFSLFSENEKKYFSKVICQRMFYDWQTDKLYRFLHMYDDVRNLRPRFVALTKQDDGAASGSSNPGGTSAADQDPFAVLTLSKLFLLSGYNPYTDTYTNTIERSPIDLDY